MHLIANHSIYSAGRGALARCGDYFYPVRLIQKREDSTGWTVHWWRENVYVAKVPAPERVSCVEEKDLVDSLWMDRDNRRKIRVCH